MNRRATALVLVFALAPLSALAQGHAPIEVGEVPASATPPARPAKPGPAKKKKLVLVLMSFAHGDKEVAALVKNALEATGRFQVQSKLPGAELIGKLEIGRSERGTSLTLSVFARGGETLLRSQKMAAANGTVIDAAKQVADEVVAVLSGEAVAQTAPTVIIPRSMAAPEKVVVPPPSSPAPAPPATINEPSRPVDAKDRIALVEPPGRAAGDDWSGERRRFSEPKPRRLDFLAGAELGFGPWSADANRIVAGSSGFDLNHYAQGFTRTLDAHWRPALSLHGGWKFLNYGAIEGAVQSSAWTGPGGAVLAGVRVSGFPLQAFMPDRKIDLGIELGGGYAFVAGGSYDMAGSYFTFGLTGEYPLNDWIGLTAFYRLYTPFLSKFYIDYKAGLTEPVQGFTAYWNTFGLGLSFHFAKTW